MTEWNAAEYAKLSGLQAAMAEQVLGLLRTRLRGDERVLDVGCGNGKVTREIAGLVPRGSVVGVMLPAKMVEFAKAASEEAGAAAGGAAPANLSFEVMDARRLTFRDEFDLVVSFNALHWIAEEQELALRGIYAALKPDGAAQLRLVPRGGRKSLETRSRSGESPQWGKYFVGVRDPYFANDGGSVFGAGRGVRIQNRERQCER